MANPIEYIVYEPDQVLTNDHLNETFNYLDQQNRWTRNKLIGIGVVCGLEIMLNTGVIQITKGCGVTSQGYLITQDATQYTYYMPYSAVAVPNDLPFTYDKGDLPFYQPFCAGKNIWLLLSDDQYNGLETAQQLTAKTLSSAVANFLSDYVVMLFLETSETDLKNCDMQDCNNKGEKIVFQVRPLLVAKNNLPGATATITTPIATISNINIATIANLAALLAPQVNLKRFNVPYADLNNSDDVINAFAKLVDDTTLTQLANVYSATYIKYSSVLNVAANPFTTLATDLKSYRDLILKQNPIFIEYFYDFIDDLLKAYNEFALKITGVISTCCPDENLFPLHLVLGNASAATNALVKDSYRNYFIYSPLFSKMGTESAEVILLFKRMVLMVQNFMAQNQAIIQYTSIKITPSQYELPWLSERAIPYYYNLNVSGSELYKAWNYYKTVNGNAALNLSYNAGQYNTNTAVTQPLLYDIEKYNFFRIEGHIGQNYQTVLSNILNQRQNFNLPIDVVAISADLLTSGVALPDCNFQDLETGYKLILGEAACKIHTTFCYISQLPYTPPSIIRFPVFGRFPGLSLINDNEIFKPNVASPKADVTTGEIPISETGITAINNPGTAVNTGATIDMSKVTPFSSFKLNMAATLEPVAVGTSAYKKGDFMRTYCTPAANTVGSAYLNALDANGVFTNPIQVDQSNALTVWLYYFFQYLDAVEELFFVLKTNTLDMIDMTVFAREYIGYQSITATIISYLSTMAQQEAAVPGAMASPYITLAEYAELDLLVGELDLLTSICIDERLQVLKDEYTRRLTQYQQQRTFLNYYKNHTGLEHKAGVPKGGTLVLVYHTASQTATVDPVTGIGLSNPILINPIITSPITHPIVTNPVVTNPIVTNPVVTNPVVTNPIVTNPVVTHPVVTNPVVNNPVVTHPVVTNPVITHPAGTGTILNSPSANNPVLATPISGTVVNNPVKLNPVVGGSILTPHAMAAQTLNNPVLSSNVLNAPVLSSGVLSGISTASPVVSAQMPVSRLLFDPATLNNLKNLVGTLNTSDDQKQLLLNLLGNQPVTTVTPTYQVADGAVIADFYIPYLCCSDCPPMAYVVPAQPVVTPPAKPVVTIAANFCDNDTKPTQIKVSVPGGTFAAVKGLDNTNQTFTPATAGAGTYSIVYTVNGLSSDAVKVTVMPTPVNTFTFVSAFNQQQQIQATFTPDSQNTAFKYQWTFGPGFSVTASTDEIPVVTAQINPTGAPTPTTVSLEVFNGTCSQPAITQNLVISSEGVKPADNPSSIKGNFQSMFTKKNKK